MISLPIVKLHGMDYFIDYRLQEVRQVDTAASIPFDNLDEREWRQVEERLSIAQSDQKAS